MTEQNANRMHTALKYKTRVFIFRVPSSHVPYISGLQFSHHCPQWCSRRKAGTRTQESSTSQRVVFVLFVFVFVALRMIFGPISSPSLANLLKMQILGLTSYLLNLNLWGKGPGTSILTRPLDGSYAHQSLRSNDAEK